MNPQLTTALAMVTADADPTTAITALDVLQMEQLTPDSLLDIVRGLVLLNLVQTGILAQVLTNRNRTRIPAEPDITSHDVLGILGYAIAQFQLRDKQRPA